MAFCSSCGKEIAEGSKFCESCGASVEDSSETPSNDKAADQTQPMTTAQPAKRKYGWATWGIPLILLILFLCCCCSSMAILSLAGAQGQPATVIPPSKAGESTPGSEKISSTSGTSVPIPTNLEADSTTQEINLKWNGVSKTDLEHYAIYKSLKSGQDFTFVDKVDPGNTNYTDSNINKGVIYYYVVTAVTTGGAESGNSNEASSIVDAPPLVPKGIYSWADVKLKCEADANYLSLLTQVTGLTKSDVDRLADKEKGGMNLKKTLTKGTIITNSTKNYKIIPNYQLKRNRTALTDENGVPHVLAKCGNPMKIQIVIPAPAIVIQQVQVIIINVINVLPPPIINIIINIAQPINTIIISITPDFIDILIGPTIAPFPPGTLIDPVDFGPDFLYDEEDLKIEPVYVHEEEEEEPEETTTTTTSTTTTTLPEGGKWIEEGQLLVIANPADPQPGQTVTMTVRLTSGEAGVDISYKVTGSDGYNASGTKKSDSNGEISFTIPGGAAGVRDTINVTVPSKGLQGSADYQF